MFDLLFFDNSEQQPISLKLYIDIASRKELEKKERKINKKIMSNDDQESIIKSYIVSLCVFILPKGNFSFLPQYNE